MSNRDGEIKRQLRHRDRRAQHIDLYFISRFKANFVSLGLTRADYCFIFIERGLLKIYDDGYTNRLYSLELEIEQPVSLSARTEEVSWRWHIWAPEFSCFTKITQGGDGAWFAGN